MKWKAVPQKCTVAVFVIKSNTHIIIKKHKRLEVRTRKKHFLLLEGGIPQRVTVAVHVAKRNSHIKNRKRLDDVRLEKTLFIPKVGTTKEHLDISTVAVFIR